MPTAGEGQDSEIDDYLGNAGQASPVDNNTRCWSTCGVVFLATRRHKIIVRVYDMTWKKKSARQTEHGRDHPDPKNLPL